MKISFTQVVCTTFSIALLPLWAILFWYIDSAMPGESLGSRASSHPTIYTALIGGIAALSTSFVAFTAAMLKVLQDKKFAIKEHSRKEKNTILIAEYVSRKILDEADAVTSRAIARDLQGFSHDEDGGGELIAAIGLDYLTITTPPQIDKLWDNLDLLPREIIEHLRILTINLDRAQKITEPIKDQDPNISYVIDRDQFLTTVSVLANSAKEIVYCALTHLKKCENAV